MYNPSTTCSTPCEELNTRSWLSSKIKLMVWSKPFSVPTIILPSEVITATVPNNWIKESISRGTQTENLEQGKEWFELLGKRWQKEDTTIQHSQYIHNIKTWFLTSSIPCHNYTKKEKKILCVCVINVACLETAGLFGLFFYRDYCRANFEQDMSPFLRPVSSSVERKWMVREWFQAC